jgi:hypothetical protein
MAVLIFFRWQAEAHFHTLPIQIPPSSEFVTETIHLNGAEFNPKTASLIRCVWVLKAIELYRLTNTTFVDKEVTNNTLAQKTKNPYEEDGKTRDLEGTFGVAFCVKRRHLRSKLMRGVLDNDT